MESRNVGECRYSQEGMDRLRKAILCRAVTDFNIAVNKLKWAEKRRNENDKVNAIGTMREVVNFIMSDWFVYLTNGICPQIDSVNGLLRKVDKKYYQQICEGIL